MWVLCIYVSKDLGQITWQYKFSCDFWRPQHVVLPWAV